MLATVKSRRDTSDDNNTTTAASTIAEDDYLEDIPPMPIIYPSDLVGRSFLMPTNDESRQHLRVKIVKAIEEYESEHAKDSSQFKFVCSIKDDIVEEILSCNEILQHLEKQKDNKII